MQFEVQSQRDELQGRQVKNSLILLNVVETCADTLRTILKA